METINPKKEQETAKKECRTNITQKWSEKGALE